MTIRQLGGSAEGFTQTIAGDARFIVGEETLLFLRKSSVKNNAGFYFLLGMSQSKYSIVANPDRGKVVQRDLSTVSLVTVGEKGMRRYQPSGDKEEPKPLQAFIRVLEEAIAGQCLEGGGQ